MDHTGHKHTAREEALEKSAARKKKQGAKVFAQSTGSLANRIKTANQKRFPQK